MQNIQANKLITKEITCSFMLLILCKGLKKKELPDYKNQFKGIPMIIRQHRWVVSLCQAIVLRG